MFGIDPVLTPLLLQASKTAGSTVPTWLALISTLAAPLVTALVAYVTLGKTNERERERLSHEEHMKSIELEHARREEERKDRLQAYRMMAKATKNIEEFDKPPESRDLEETLAEIELLTESPTLLKAATDLADATARARTAVYEYGRLKDARGGVVTADEEKAVNSVRSRATDLRKRFIEEVRSEIRQTPP